VFDVINRLVQQHTDVRVLKRVDDAATATIANNKAEVPQDAKLMRNR